MSASVGFVRVELYPPQSVELVDGRLRQLPHSSDQGVKGDSDSRGDAVGRSQMSTQNGLNPTPSQRQQLLCNLRTILRKLGKRVLVGDQVGGHL